MKKTRWKITLRLVRAHAGIRGNELADTLTKKAVTNENITESYKRFPRSVVLRELQEESLRKWQREWIRTSKGRTMKEFFPDEVKRINMKINLTQNFITIVTGHGKTRAYLHRFKVIEKTNIPLCQRGPDNKPPNFRMRTAN
jgi:primosomal protein N'